MTKDLLEAVLQQKRELFKTRGFRVSLSLLRPESFSANFDGAAYVGTLTCWSNGQCEMQFNSCKSGAVVVLETEQVFTEIQLSRFIDEMIGRLEIQS